MDVAEQMEVSKPSVSHAVKLLCEGGFLEMHEDYSLHLTKLGREVGERLYERHQYIDLLTEHKVKLLCVRERMMIGSSSFSPFFT